MVRAVWLCTSLEKKLKALKPVLRTLSKDNYQNIHHKVEDTRGVLIQLQKEMLLSPTVDLFSKVQAQDELLSRLLEVEESFLR